MKSSRPPCALVWIALWLGLPRGITAEPEHFAGILPALQGAVPTREIIPDLPIDAIPPLDDPLFVSAQAASIADEDMVEGVALEGEAFAYPINIMNFHEIVNHTVGGHRVATTYCPLTNSSVLFDIQSDIPMGFGNTGALFNNNVVMYDRETRSFWAQMAAGSIFGPRAGDALKLLPVAQTTWGAWKKLHPETMVLSQKTGFESTRNYSTNIYVNFGYSTNTDIYFPQSPPIDQRLPPKTMVFGLAHAGLARAYTYPTLAEAGLANDRFADTEILVLFSEEAQLALGYLRELEGRIHHFTVLADEASADGLPLFSDVETGSTWNILGQAVDGPLKGRSLTPIAAYSAYWFGWASFWQDTEIWDGTNPEPFTAVEARSWGQIKAEMKASGAVQR